MKLKYYLRGLGTGIIFATLVMTVSSVIHNNNLSEKKIIKEAQKLGMVMPEETEKGGLFAPKDDTESIIPETEGVNEESSEIDEEPTETISDEPESQEIQSNQEEPIAEQEEPVEEPETSVNTNTENITYVQIQIPSGSTARIVGKILLENGLIENAEDFRVYMGSAGYAKKICVGEFSIPVGATYEEICEIVTSRPR